MFFFLPSLIVIVNSAIKDFEQNISLNYMRVKIISYAFTLIPAVHNENVDNEKSEDDNDITTEEEEDEISWK